MNIEITGRHIEVTPALREHVSEKLSKLDKLIDEPVDIHVVLFIEKHRHVAEIQIKARQGVFSGQEETGDLYISIAEVADKLEKQLRRSKDKRTARRRRDAVRTADAAVTMNEEALDEDAAPAPEGNIAGRIVRSENYRLKPMSPEDAAIELESSGQDVLVFRDAETDRVNVLHRKQDDTFGLVDPEF